MAAVAGRAGRRVPRRRHEPGRPPEARRRRRPDAAGRRQPRCRSTSVEDAAGRRAADRRRASATATWPPTRGVRARYPVLVAGAAGRRVGPAAQPRHDRRQPAAAHPLRRTSRTSPRRATSASRARGCSALRGLPRATCAILGRLRALRGHPPLGHGGRAGRARRRRAWSLGPDGERRDPDRASCTGCPATTRSATPCWRTASWSPRSSCRRCRSRAGSAYRKVRDRASYAFALVSVAAALDVDDGVDPRRADRARRRGAQAVAGDRAPRTALRGAPRHRGRRSAPPPRPSWRRAPSRCRDNAFKIPMARNTIVATLRDLAGGAGDDRPTLAPRAVGAAARPHRRRARRSRGTATYAFEQPVEHAAPTCTPVQATIARGRITAVDTSAARGLRRACSPCSRTSTRRGWPTPSDGELADPAVATRSHFRGQLIGAVVAETPEIARHGRRRWCASTYDEHAARRRAAAPTAPTSTSRRRSTRPSRPTPSEGDVDGGAGGRGGHGRRRRTRTPMEHNNPMEPHADDRAVGRTAAAARSTTPPRARTASRATLAQVFGLDDGPGAGDLAVRRRRVRLQGHAARPRRARACMAARALPGRPVKLALTRQQMFALVGYRTPTIQRIRLGADADGRLHRDRPRRRRADLAHQGVRRADRGRRPG